MNATIARGGTPHNLNIERPCSAATAVSSYDGARALAAAVDAELDDDRRFFAARPWRTHRVRPVFDAEAIQIEEVCAKAGKPCAPPPGLSHFVGVRQIAPGLRARAFFFGSGGAAADIGDGASSVAFRLFGLGGAA